jgi:hypothetical protein
MQFALHTIFNSKTHNEWKMEMENGKYNLNKNIVICKKTKNEWLNGWFFYCHA